MDCPHRHRLNAYHDAELDDAESRALERHLATCTACTAELEEIRDLSRLFAGLAESEISQAAMTRAHASADHASEQAESTAQGRRLLVRVAGALTAVAASVLVVASAWLVVPPATPTPIGHLAVGPRPAPAPAAEWERIAMTLDAGPLLTDSPVAPGRIALAAAVSDSGDDMRVAEWMIRNLSR